MSVVETPPVETEAVGPATAKMRVLAETAEAEQEGIQELKARSLALQVQEAREREQEIEANPGGRSGKGGALSKSAQTARKRGEIEKQIAGREADQAARAVVLAKTAAEAGREQRAIETKVALASQAEERAALEHFGRCYAALAAAWLAVREIQQDRYMHTGSVRQSGVLDGASAEEADAWSRASTPVGVKVAASFARAFSLAYQASTDPGCRFNEDGTPYGVAFAGSWPEFVPEFPGLAQLRVVPYDHRVELAHHVNPD
jgi:hypothetical protein